MRNSANRVRPGAELLTHLDVAGVYEHGTGDASVGFASFTTLLSSATFTALPLELEIFVMGDRRVRELRVYAAGVTPAEHTRS